LRKHFFFRNLKKLLVITISQSSLPEIKL
jgi:hypothetical protein